MQYGKIEMKLPPYVDGSAMPGANIIRNGDFEVAQRGATFAAANGYTLDGFNYGMSSDGVVTVTQDTDVPTFSQAGHLSKHSIKLQVTTADVSIAAGQFSVLHHSIEGYDFYPCVGKSVTLSFCVKAKKTGVYCVSFRSSTGDRSMIKEYTVLAADTWEKKTVTLVMDYSGGTWNYANGIGLSVTWTLASGATYQTTKDAWQSGVYLATSSQVNALDSTDNYFSLSQVKLEIGQVASQFQPEPYAASLARCQRYLIVYSGNGTYVGDGFIDTATSAYLRITFPCFMRDIPAISFSGATDYVAFTATDAPFASTGMSDAGATVNGKSHGFVVFANSLANMTTVIGNTAMLKLNAANAYILVSAEL